MVSTLFSTLEASCIVFTFDVMNNICAHGGYEQLLPQLLLVLTFGVVHVEIYHHLVPRVWSPLLYTITLFNLVVPTCSVW